MEDSDCTVEETADNFANSLLEKSQSRVTVKEAQTFVPSEDKDGVCSPLENHVTAEHPVSEQKQSQVEVINKPESPLLDDKQIEGLADQFGVISDDEELFVTLPEINIANGSAKTGSKFVKQISLPERTVDLQGVVLSGDTNLRSGVSHSCNIFLSPYSSSNTLSGSMHTASEGMNRSRSGITSTSDYTDVFLPSNDNSFCQFPQSTISSLDQLTFHSCHSDLKYLSENDKIECIENAMNEEKLKGLIETGHDSENKRRTNDKPRKTRLFKGLNKRKWSKRKTCSEKEKKCNNSKVQLVAKMDSRNSDLDSSKVIHGILKSSVSTDSCLVSNDGFKEDSRIVEGGTKAVVVEKVSQRNISNRMQIFSTLF